MKHCIQTTYNTDRILCMHPINENKGTNKYIVEVNISHNYPYFRWLNHMIIPWPPIHYIIWAISECMYTSLATGWQERIVYTGSKQSFSKQLKHILTNNVPVRIFIISLEFYSLELTIRISTRKLYATRGPWCMALYLSPAFNYAHWTNYCKNKFLLKSTWNQEIHGAGLFYPGTIFWK